MRMSALLRLVASAGELRDISGNLEALGAAPRAVWDCWRSSWQGCISAASRLHLGCISAAL